jgi:hypothetical protein
MEAAQMFADHQFLSPIVIDGFGENDRSATGYLPRVEFETVADNFFACPENSVRGWERAIDAQRRIAEAVNRAISLAAADTDMAIISHVCCRRTLVVPPEGRANQPKGGPTLWRRRQHLFVRHDQPPAPHRMVPHR